MKKTDVIEKDSYVIRGGNPLVGEVEIGGAKNAALAIVAAAIMTDETVTIENMPDVRDTNVMLEAMQGIGVIIDRVDRHTVKINGSMVKNVNIDTENIKKRRGVFHYKNKHECANFIAQ